LTVVKSLAEYNVLTHEGSSELFEQALISSLPKDKEIWFVCIGTSGLVGDAFGPLIGTRLEALDIRSVLGTTSYPVHAVNLETVVAGIHPDMFIMGIDASLTKNRCDVGIVRLHEGPVRPGAGVQKLLPPVGNLHITMCVNFCDLPTLSQIALMNTSLPVITQGVNFVVKNIKAVYRRLKDVA
jgi:putative sporulation protein YyaC